MLDEPSGGLLIYAEISLEWACFCFLNLFEVLPEAGELGEDGMFFCVLAI